MILRPSQRILSNAFDTTYRRFHPAQYGNLKWWINAANLSSLFQDSAGSTAVTADGDPVGKWNDLSSMAAHATQGTSANRATYKTNIKNGLPILRFDGSNDTLATAAPVITSTTSFEMFLVSKANASTSERIPLHNGTSTNGYGISQSTWTTSKKGFLLGGVAWVDSSESPDTTNFIIYLLRRSSGTTTLYKNGTSIASSAAAPAAPTTRTILGDYTNGSQPVSCDIGESLIYEGMSTGEANQIGNYLASKWGLSWSNI